MTASASETGWVSPVAPSEEERARNRRVAVLVPLAPVVAVAVVGGLIGAALAASGALVVGLVVAAAALVLGGALTAGLLATPTHPERLLSAVRVPDGAAPRLENLVVGLCATFGVVAPPLFVVEDRRINLAMVATPMGSAMVVTRGVLEDLDLLDLEGLVAHGLAHVRLDAVRRGTLAAALPRPFGSDALRHHIAGRGRLLRADEVAALAVRYPTRIVAVLERCVGQPAPSASSFFASDRFERTRWLWFDPTPGERVAPPGELDAPSVRAEVLSEW